MTFDETMEAKIPSLTVDDVNKAFRSHVDPAVMSVIQAGDFWKAGVLQ